MESEILQFWGTACLATRGKPGDDKIEVLNIEIKILEGEGMELGARKTVGQRTVRVRDKCMDTEHRHAAELKVRYVCERTEKGGKGLEG
jgi:hypothetical protein